MAIQVTGSLKIGYASYLNPQIRLIPHLTYRGSIAMDASINVFVESQTSGSVGSWVGATMVPFYPKTSDLSYPSVKVDPYSDLISALDQYTITQLTGSNPDCTFNTF